MKVLVAHPAQQHSYRLATALKRAGMLSHYATTVYYKKKSLTSFVAKVLQGNFRIKAMKRRCEELDDSCVIQFCEAEGLLKLVALNTPYFKKQYNQIKYYTADRFAKKVARFAIKHQVDAVITYDDSSPILFEILKKQAPNIIRIMDMSAANLLYMRSIYEHDMLLSPAFARRLRKERSIVWDSEICDRAEREIRAAQHFLVPSQFVARSLEYSGVTVDQMHICPYGVDIDQFSQSKTHRVRNKPLKCIYVGGVKELKGISYLLKAFEQIPSDIAQLTVVGAVNKSDLDIAPYIDKVVFTGSVMHAEVAKMLQESDIYVFPSLGEGLSLSTLEAAGCGLPLIVSENSGVNDYVRDGTEGFVIPIQATESIVEKILWFADNMENIDTMGTAARKMAEHFDWENYYVSVAHAIEERLG